jgi:hypothetical protein
MKSFNLPSSPIHSLPISLTIEQDISSISNQPDDKSSHSLNLNLRSTDNNKQQSDVVDAQPQARVSVECLGLICCF